MRDAAGRAEMESADVSITCAGIRVRPDDLVFGDVDGVLVIPAEAAEEAVRLALEKIRGEDTVREELARGEPLAEVFARHGIL